MSNIIVKSFISKNGRDGAMYSEPVECVSPTGEKVIRIVIIIAKIYIETV